MSTLNLPNRWTPLIVAAAGLLIAGAGCDRGLHRDEIVQFFPTYGRFDAGSNTWTCEIRGWVYENGNRANTAALVAGELLSIADPKDDQGLSKQRVRTFFVDKQRDKHLVTRIGPTVARPPPSDIDGFFAGQAKLPADAAAVLPADPFTGVRSIDCSVVTPTKEQQFRGDIYLIPPTGLSVISDIDDTIRKFPGDSKATKMFNLFRREFEAVPGMAEQYQRWRELRGAVFHYVSKSAWQFTPWLERFLEKHEFPAGSLHLRAYKIKLPIGLESWGPSKLEMIERLLQEFPQRRFILVGDTSEEDPEIYAEVARKHAAQVERIFLRNTTDEECNSQRMGEAMKDLPDTKWVLFNEPHELNAVADTPLYQVP